MFSRTLHGPDGCSKFVLKFVFSRKPDAEPKKGIGSCRATALTSVMSKWYASCTILRQEKRKLNLRAGRNHHWRLEWKKLSTPASKEDKISHKKHWDWQEDRTPMLRHGSVVRPTMSFASMDIKAAFDEARPRHVAKHHGQSQLPMDG